MNISPFFFYLFGGIAIACSLMVVIKRNPVASAFNLVLVFFSFAAIYAMLDAHLLAALQILVYAGAIMVLFIFVIMLLSADAPSLDMDRTPLFVKVTGAFIVVMLLNLFVWVFKNSAVTVPHGPFSPEAVNSAGGNTRVLAELLFSDYILPFELTSVLLLAGIVGAVAMAKRKLGDGK